MNHLDESRQTLGRKTPWTLVALSLFMTGLTFCGFMLYAEVHSLGSRTASLAVALDDSRPDVTSSPEARELANEIHKRTTGLLSKLEAYRLLGLGAALVAVWSGFRRPRWACLIALLPATCAVLVSIVIQ